MSENKEILAVTEKIDGGLKSRDSIVPEKEAVFQYIDANNKLASCFSNFIKALSSGVDSPMEEATIPESSIEIETFIKLLKDKIEQATTISEQYLIVLQKAEKDISSFRLTSPADVTKLKALVDTATQADVSIRKSETEKKSAVELLNRSHEKIIDAKLRESGFDSMEAVNSRRIKVNLEAGSLKRKYFGLGSIISKEEISALMLEHDRLEDLRYSKNYFKMSYHDVHEYQLKNCEAAIAEALVESIKSFSKLVITELDSLQEKEMLELSPELVSELNDAYLEEIVREEIQLAVKGQESFPHPRGGKKINIEEQIDRALAILKKSFSIKKYKDNSLNEPVEVSNLRAEIRKELQELPNLLTEIIDWRMRSDIANNAWSELNQSLSSWKKELYASNLKDNVKSIKNLIASSTSSAVSGMSYSLSEIYFPAIDKGGRYEKKEVVDIDIERFKIFTSNKTVIEEFGSEVIEKNREMLEAEIITSLHQQIGERTDHILLKKLIKLESLKATPFIFLDAFRVTGDGGGHHLIATSFGDLSSNSELYKYIASLSDDRIESLRGMNIPGQLEIINLIKNNKDSFATRSVKATQDEDNDEWINNPVYTQINKELERMSCYYLESGTDDEKMFILRTIEDSKEPLGAQAGLIQAIISGPQKTPNLSERAAGMLISRFKYLNDFGSLKLLSESEDISQEDMEIILQKLAFDINARNEIVKQNLSGKETLGEKFVSKLSEMMGQGLLKERFLASVAAFNLGLNLPVSPADIIEFVRSIEKIKVIFRGDEVVDSIVNLAENIDFTREESLQIAKAISCSEDLFTKIAYQWPGTIRSLEKRKFRIDLDLVVGEIEKKVVEMVKSSDAAERFKGYIIAENLKLPILPSSQDVVMFFKNIDDIHYHSQATDIFNPLSDFFARTKFNDDEVSQIANIIAKTDRYYEFNAEDARLLKDFITKLPISEKFTAEERNSLLISMETPREMLKSDIILSKENWAALLRLYVLSDMDSGILTENEKKKIKNAFSNEHPESRDYCLDKLQGIWQGFLDSSGGAVPVEMAIVSNAVKKSGGEVGDLKYVAALMNLFNSVGDLREIKKTSPKTKADIISGLRGQEVWINENSLSEDDKAAFYNISNSIIKAAPSLYTDFLKLFEVMEVKVAKKFFKEIFPLYQANLIVLEKGDEGVFSGRDLIPIRKRLESMFDEIKKDGSDVSEILALEKANLVSSIQKTFERRFGLLKVPEDLNEGHIRTLQNCIRYIGNIQGRDKTKEAEVSLFLGLSLNGEWQNFRAGAEINLAGYFNGEYLEILEPILQKRQRRDAALPDVVGLPDEEKRRFQIALQEETISTTIGNIQTIDIKLGNMKTNIEDLADPDIYNEQADKETFTLLKESGKAVGSTLSKIYAESVGKKVGFIKDETEIRKKLEKIFGVDTWSSQKVKEVQDKIQVPNLICGILRKLDEERVDEEINKLHVLLTPSSEVMEIFNNFGENFKVSSGALALSEDLTYLENVMVKNESKMSLEQKTTLEVYLDKIRAQMSVLEDLYARTKEYFEKINKSVHTVKNDILKNRLNNIGKILYQSSEDKSVVTRITSNLDLIIENMRQCLGCLTKEVNNDSNLTFGEYYKFYMMSQSGREKGSIADQILYLLPITIKEGEEEVSLVMDRIYGSKTPDVIFAHINAVVNKYLALKREFSDAKFSVLITESALSGTGVSVEKAVKKIEELFDGLKVSHLSNITVSIPESALGDNYTEFHPSGPRYHGDVRTSGLRVQA